LPSKGYPYRSLRDRHNPTRDGQDRTFPIGEKTFIVD